MSNGNGHAPATAVRENVMMLCTKDLTTTLDGEVLELRAGLDRVGADHEIFARHPAHFRPVRGGEHGARSAVVDGMIEGAQNRRPVRAMTLEQELTVRRERLAQLERRERDRPAAEDATERFWRGVDELLGFAQRERDDKREIELFDALHESRARSLQAEREELANWLGEA